MAKKLATIVFVSSMLAFIPAVNAATVGVITDNAAPMIGQEFQVDVAFDTQGENANAVQGEIDFPAASFSLANIDDGNSPVTFWIQPPQKTASGVVSFLGIIPGGFTGAASSVVRLVLKPLAAGAASITLGGLQLLRNDGQATPIPVTATGATITVSPVIATSSPAAENTPITTPELFTPVISRDPSIYGGQYFLAFSTVDKGSGIDHYEVMEVPTGSGTAGTQSWQIATSPYLLKDQTLSSDIYVRAVNHAGNFLVIKVPAQHPVTAKAALAAHWLAILELCAFAIALLLLALFLKRRRHAL